MRFRTARRLNNKTGSLGNAESIKTENRIFRQGGIVHESPYD